MDFHLDSLLNFPDVTVITCQQQEGFIVLKLDFLNEGITCPHCQNYLDDIHQTRSILVRDLGIFGQVVYLNLPRRQFYCRHCKKYPTEPLDFVEKRRNYTIRYLVNKALNKIRLLLDLKGLKNRILLIKNSCDLREEEKLDLRELLNKSPCLNIAYELKEELRNIYETSTTIKMGLRKIKKAVPGWGKLHLIFNLEQKSY